MAGPPGPGMAATAAALLPRSRGAWLAALAAVAMVSLVLSVLVARAHRAAAASTAGYRTVQVSGATAGSAAGFRMKIPAGWQSAQRGPTTAFTSPDGAAVIQVTPAVFHAARAVGEARLLEAVALRRGTFPGYQRITLHAAGFHGRPGAVWEFTWQPASGPRAEVQRMAVPAGYPGWAAGLPGPGVRAGHGVAPGPGGLHDGAGHLPVPAVSGPPGQ